MQWLLTQTIEAGRKSGAIDESSVKRVAVDTTVMEKAIAYPKEHNIRAALTVGSIDRRDQLHHGVSPIFVGV